MTRCEEVRFALRSGLRTPWSEVVRGVCGRPLVTVVLRPFWHGRGTPPGHKLSARPALVLAEQRGQPVFASVFDRGDVRPH